MKDNRARTIVFSGDVGNADVPILPPTESIDEADVIIAESTYGDRDHEPSLVRMDKLKNIIDRIVSRGGTLLIPAFSIERTQELIYELDRLVDAGEMPNIPIYLDSPLAIHSTEVYDHFSDYLRFDRNVYSSPDRDFFSFPNLYVTLSVDESRKINDDHGPKIIVAGAGMMTGGRILHHLKRYIEDEHAGIFIVGYQAEGTLGRRILSGIQEVNIHHETYKVKAHVEAIGAFSSHADRTKLREWLKPRQGEAREIYLVHGDPKVKPAFKEFLQAEIKSEIIIPQYWQTFEY